jgi:H+/gluconate symporter-like permease
MEVYSSFDSMQTKSRSFSMMFNVTVVLSVATVTMVDSFSVIDIPVYETKSVTFHLVVPEPPSPGGKKGISDALLIGICTGAALLIVLFLGALRLLKRSNDSHATIPSDDDTLGEITVTMTETTNLDSTRLDADVMLGEGRRYRELSGSDDDDFRVDGFQEGDIYV